MSPTRALLLIADIGGYTRFMRLHRMSLAHAQENTARLLEAVIDAAPRLTLVDIEGDAAFFYVPAPADEEVARSIAAVAVAIHRSFHFEQERMNALSVCRCDACHQTGLLTVKAVAHLGDVVEQTIRGKTSIAGPDVILVHRMLKNSVPVGEYVLMTDPVYRLSAEALPAATPLDEELEGLGTERLWYVDMGAIAEPPPPAPRPGGLARLRYAAGLTGRSLPYYAGLRRSRARA